jgi:hypothetical protein
VIRKALVRAVLPESLMGECHAMRRRYLSYRGDAHTSVLPSLSCPVCEGHMLATLAQWVAYPSCRKRVLSLRERGLFDHRGPNRFRTLESLKLNSRAACGTVGGQQW